MPVEPQGSPNSQVRREERLEQHRMMLDTTETACCITGAGPAGAMLALLIGIGFYPAHVAPALRTPTAERIVSKA